MIGQRRSDAQIDGRLADGQTDGWMDSVGTQTRHIIDGDDCGRNFYLAPLTPPTHTFLDVMLCLLEVAR